MVDREKNVEFTKKIGESGAEDDATEGTLTPATPAVETHSESGAAATAADSTATYHSELASSSDCQTSTLETRFKQPKANLRKDIFCRIFLISSFVILSLSAGLSVRLCLNDII